VTRVAVVGVGQVPFTGPVDDDPADMAAQALRAALADGGVEPGAVDLAAFGSVYEHPFLGQRVLLRLGLNGIGVVNQENACASGTAAIVEACRWIESGAADLVAVAGVEKLASKWSSGPIPWDPTDIFGGQGLTMPAFYGLLAEYHMAHFGSTRADYAGIAAKNRNYAVHNSYARFRQPVTVDDVLAAPEIASPLGKYDCCPNGDGAAAAVLASEAVVRRFDREPVWITAAVLASGRLGDRFDGDPMTAASARAYEQAGVGPDDIDVVECHDNFSAAELECYEGLGFCAEGEGHLYFRKGLSGINGGGAAFNPSGGLLGRSHPSGATGPAQLASITHQLRGEAGAVQHEGARVGLVHTSGGGVLELQSNVCVVLVVQR
jgi:acetyl-CoA acetyltransferase